MVSKQNILRHCIALAMISICLLFVTAAFSQGERRPVIIIPGVTGSELINEKTGETVWFKARRSKFDDIRLPIGSNPTRTRDQLKAGDILRSVKIGILPRIDVYGGLIDALKTRGGYHEETWDAPTEKGGEAAIYVFPYDWRLDNVGNARQLVRKIEKLKAKLGRPDLKFDVIAHSMGGILARYAAMYGDADLPTGTRKPVPTWAGAKFFDKVVLLGTPNEGSVLTLNAMINGFGLGPITVNLPFVQNVSKFDVFTIPSAYELLPAPGTFRAVNESFEPVDIDIYDPKEWVKYGWRAIDDRKFNSQFDASERKVAVSFFERALARAKRLHESLAAADGVKGLQFELIGGECRETLDTIVVYKDQRKNVWKTLFRAESFKRAGGEKVTADELKKVMFMPGDGVVTKRSFEAVSESQASKVPSILRPMNTKFVCEDHNRQGTNIEIQDYLITLFGGKVISKPVEKVK